MKLRIELLQRKALSRATVCTVTLKIEDEYSRYVGIVD